MQILRGWLNVDTRTSPAGGPSQTRGVVTYQSSIMIEKLNYINTSPESTSQATTDASATSRPPDTQWGDGLGQSNKLDFATPVPATTFSTASQDSPSPKRNDSNLAGLFDPSAPPNTVPRSTLAIIISSVSGFVAILIVVSVCSINITRRWSRHKSQEENRYGMLEEVSSSKVAGGKEHELGLQRS